ncbi:hypothetical protein FBU59_005024 [Linderina macrospora]|uniref:Uncharacterized protein n=1 Tax=Linderina macrospora TaxID=4868 RepID=A0ACC1J438_9FUNG|nr:hypothetical protein FBU59_005024 [Linderina macrospora]
MLQVEDMTPRSVSRRSNNTAANTTVSKSEAGSVGFNHHSSPRPSRHSSLRQHQQPHLQQNSYNNNQQQQQQTSSARNEYARRNAVLQKHQSQRNGSKNGKQNNSNQRPHAKSDPAQSKSEDEQQQQQQVASVPSSKRSGGRGSRKQNKQHGKVTLLTKSASEGEQQAMLSKFSDGQSKRSRRRQASPPRNEEDFVFPQPPVVHHGSASVPPGKTQSRSPPRRGHNKHQQHAVVSGPATIYSPTPQAPATVAPFGAGQLPSSYGINRGPSPSFINKSNHYAGASFNNSPAPNTLPLPPMFLTSSSPPLSSATAREDDGMFGVSPNAHVRPEQLLVRRPEAQAVNVALSERSRQLEDMLVRGNIIHNNNSQSAVDLTQPAADMTLMFQKLRLIKEMSQNRAATVSPMSNGALTPSYHA